MTGPSPGDAGAGNNQPGPGPDPVRLLLPPFVESFEHRLFGAIQPIPLVALRMRNGRESNCIADNSIDQPIREVIETVSAILRLVIERPPVGRFEYCLN